MKKVWILVSIMSGKRNGTYYWKADNKIWVADIADATQYETELAVEEVALGRRGGICFLEVKAIFVKAN